MSKLYDQLQGAERERIEREKAAEEVASARIAEEKRGLDLARERQAAEVELRRMAHARAEAETKAARLVAERERAEAQALSEAKSLAYARLDSTLESSIKMLKPGLLIGPRGGRNAANEADDQGP